MEVKVKPVELIELFYDLIFVYAISKLTALVSEPVNGIIPPYSFFCLSDYVFCNPSGMALLYKLCEQVRSVEVV